MAICFHFSEIFSDLVISAMRTNLRSPLLLRSTSLIFSSLVSGCKSLEKKKKSDKILGHVFT